MLLSAVSVLVVAQSSSEIPEGLMNNPVYPPVIMLKLQKEKLLFGDIKRIKRITVQKDIFLFGSSLCAKRASRIG